MTETVATRTKTRRVKDHILDRYLLLADRVSEKGEGDLSDKELGRYWELTGIFAKNVVPRTTEITGEEGQAIILAFDKTFNGNQDASNSTPETAGDSKESGSV